MKPIVSHESTEQRAAEAGDEAADGERGELRPGRRHRERGRGGLVLAHADDGPPDAAPAQMPDEHDTTTRTTSVK